MGQALVSSLISIKRISESDMCIETISPHTSAFRHLYRFNNLIILFLFLK